MRDKHSLPIRMRKYSLLPMPMHRWVNSKSCYSRNRHSSTVVGAFSSATLPPALSHYKPVQTSLAGLVNLGRQVNKTASCGSLWTETCKNK